MKPVVFSAHALSVNEIEKVNILIESTPLYISLFELKQTKSLKVIAQELASYKGRDIYVFQDFENSDLLKGFLYTLPLASLNFRFRSIEAEGKIFTRNYVDSLCQLFLMGITTFWNFSFALLFKIVSHFPKGGSSRFDYVHYNKLKSCLYLKSNFWFGIQAGGSIGHIAGVANRLSDFFDVVYLAPDKPQLLESKVKIVLVKSNYRFSLPYELNNLGFNLLFIKKVKLFIEADFYYQRLSLYNFTGALMSLILKKPLILEYNGSEVWIQKNWSAGLKWPKLASAIEHFNLKIAARIVTVSEVLKDELVHEGYDAKKIVFYPNCIDPKKYSPDIVSESDKELIRIKLGFNKENFIFTFVGTFGPWHGVEFLMASINAFFMNPANSHARFLLIGDGVLKKKCEYLLLPEFKEKVLFTGLIPQDKTPDFLAISDCFLSPHVKREGEKFFGSPTKLFEYMAMAKPIIASSLEQIGKLFEHPVSVKDLRVTKKSDGLLFEPNNLLEFKQEMEFVLNLSKEDFEHLGKNSRALALKKYTWYKHVEEILS
jgi:glycosyltransferase involved in cell wall biosynthesis